MIEFSKSTKLTLEKSNIISLADIKEKLFVYYNKIIYNEKQSCLKCDNLMENKIILKNEPPLYFNISLSYFNGNKSITMTRINNSELLRIFVLCPIVFELSSLFENMSNKKVFYKINGFIALEQRGIYSNYSTFLRTNRKNGNSEIYQSWTYYKDQIVTEIGSYFDVLFFCINNEIIPINILYQQLNDINLNTQDCELSFEQLSFLEKYTSDPFINYKKIIQKEIYYAYNSLDNTNTNFESFCQTPIFNTKLNSLEESKVIQSQLENNMNKIKDSTTITINNINQNHYYTQNIPLNSNNIHSSDLTDIKRPFDATLKVEDLNIIKDVKDFKDLTKINILNKVNSINEFQKEDENLNSLKNNKPPTMTNKIDKNERNLNYKDINDNKSKFIFIRHQYASTNKD